MNIERKKMVLNYFMKSQNVTFIKTEVLEEPFWENVVMIELSRGPSHETITQV